MIRRLIVMMVSILLISCTTPTRTLDPAAPCDAILKPALLSVPFDTFVPEGPETEAWILTTFPTATVQYRTRNTVDGELYSEEFTWSEGDKYYTLNLRPVGRYIKQRTMGLPQPTLGHILRCFSEPAYYLPEVDVPVGGSYIGTLFSVWYPDLGISFQDVNIGSTGPFRYTSRSPMGLELYITPIGSLEEMLQNFDDGTGEYVKLMSPLFQKWPDNFTEIVVGK